MNEKRIKKLTKKFIFFTILLLFFQIFQSKTLFFSIFNQKNNENAKNITFLDGESLKYKISYGATNKKKGVLLAGYAYFNLKDSMTSENLAIHRIHGYGRTTKVFSLFMKIKHSYTSIVTRHRLNTIESKMEIIEGKYYNKNHTLCSTKKDQECVIKISEKKNNGEIENLTKTKKKINANDILGAFYKLRTMDHQKLLKSDTIFFSYYYNNEVFNSHFINMGEEIVETRFGTIKTIKCAPLLEKGRMFKSKYGAFVWVTADNMHIPVKLEIPVLVGSVYVTLARYEKTIFDLKE